MGFSLRPRAARLRSPHPHTELGLAGMHHIHLRCGCRAFFLEGLAPGLVGERVHTCPSRVKITYRSRKILAVATRARVGDEKGVAIGSGDDGQLMCPIRVYPRVTYACYIGVRHSRVGFGIL